MAPPASPSRAGIPLRVVEAVSVSPPRQSWLEMAHVLGAAQVSAEPPGVVVWLRASSGITGPGWMLVLVQNTDNADGGYSQTPGTPCWPR